MLIVPLVTGLREMRETAEEARPQGKVEYRRLIRDNYRKGFTRKNSP